MQIYEGICPAIIIKKHIYLVTLIANMNIMLKERKKKTPNYYIN